MAENCLGSGFFLPFPGLPVTLLFRVVLVVVVGDTGRSLRPRVRHQALRSLIQHLQQQVLRCVDLQSRSFVENRSVNHSEVKLIKWCDHNAR